MSINIFPLIFDSILIMLAVFALVFSRDSRLSQKTRRALLFLGLGLCLLIISAARLSRGFLRFF